MRIDWKGIIIPKVNELLGSYSYRPTLRQIFYRLVAALLIPNTEVTYKSLSRATVDAREEALIDPLAFQDALFTPVTEIASQYRGAIPALPVSMRQPKR